MSGRPASKPAVCQKTKAAAAVAIKPSGTGLVSQANTRPTRLEAASVAELETRSKPGNRPAISRTVTRLLRDGSPAGFMMGLILAPESPARGPLGHDAR